MTTLGPWAVQLRKHDPRWANIVTTTGNIVASNLRREDAEYIVSTMNTSMRLVDELIAIESRELRQYREDNL